MRWLGLKGQGMRLVVRVWGWVVIERIWSEKVRRLVRDESVVFRWSEVGGGGGGGGGGFMVVLVQCFGFQFRSISTELFNRVF
ncbi:hypothetical protein TSUD_297580 [Trifolium subterraneum]|uniref:Uncharacterized protein n=1 Tax=Trifolium subterraneum TaxID=3900 RepID=A0A2Z6MCZ5_TRISU|nr:hypothetical protein TSUD_297580 [Trifolium subterraneum]